VNKLSKYVEFYKRKVQKLKMQDMSIYDFYKSRNFDINTFLDYKFIDYMYIFIAGINANNFDSKYALITGFEKYFERIEDNDYAELATFYMALTKAFEKNNIDKYKINLEDSYNEQIECFNNMYCDKIREFISKVFMMDSINYIDFASYNAFIELLFNDVSKNFMFIVSVYELKTLFFRAKEKGTLNSKMKALIIKDKGAELKEVLSSLNDVKNTIILAYKNFNSIKQKALNLLKLLEKEISEGKLIEVNKYKSLGEELLFAQIYIYNSEIQKKEYDIELKREKKLDNEELNALEDYIYKENINISIEELKVSNEEALMKIKLLNKFKEIIQYNNIMICIINNISIDNLKNLVSFIDSKYFDELFFINNIIYFKNDKLLNNFIDNINLLNNNNISIFNVMKYDYRILFRNNKYLLNLINVYLKYQINIDSECYNFEWLLNDKSYIIDKFIEIGQYDLIKNNPSLLNKGTDIIVKRCILYLDLVNPLINEQGKLRGNLRKEENFIMSDEELNNTVLDNSNEMMPNDVLHVLNIKKINNLISEYNLNNFRDYLQDDYTFNFNGILISKNKVIKNMAILLNSGLEYSESELLLYAIIYNYPKLLSIADITGIKEIIKNNIKILKKANT